ncbi:MAG: NAD(P)/FAD-dependent oxidoreductase [Thaumarchaeota archaeon]|nr:NAD(P)/FAD-dependent oxidoreductase [Nitrososphaerota archaeon]
MQPDLDVIIIGGGVSGLISARELSKRGYSVKLFEEDLEIGVPEHCDGMVSAKGLSELGVIPSSRSLENEIRRAILHSPSGFTLEINADKQGTVVLDRSVFDRELAVYASRSGTDIQLGKRVETVKEEESIVRAAVNSGTLTARYVVDARGCAASANRWRGRLLQAAKYEVQGKWFDRDAVELFFDQNVSPGFFTWVIPIGDDQAKVGVAGSTINPFKVLDKFLEKRSSKVLKKVAAPIVVGGPAPHFSLSRVVSVGDAAGQAKPTTGGGIYTGGMGGLLAGKALADCLDAGDGRRLEKYEETWVKMFGKEFKAMVRVRRMLGGLSNKRVDELFKAVGGSGLLEKVSPQGDFDFHSRAILKALGFEGALKIVGEAAVSELRSLFSGKI